MKKVKEFLPSLLGIFISLFALLINVVFSEKVNVLTCFQILSMPMILFLLQAWSMTKKIHIPKVFSYVLLIHLFLALVLGSGFDFYNKIACWDMILHGYFGFVASLFVFILLLNYNGEKLHPVLFIAILFLTTMGAAGMWEIYEFVMDRVLGGDTQRVQESISLGYTPVYDTMMDMIIAISGILVFYVCLLIDKICNYKISKSLYFKIKSTKSLLQSKSEKEIVIFSHDI